MTVTSGNDVETVTITVTAEKNGKQAKAEYKLTVRGPIEKTYIMDFDNHTSVETVGTNLVADDTILATSPNDVSALSLTKEKVVEIDSSKNTITHKQ